MVSEPARDRGRFGRPAARASGWPIAAVANAKKMGVCLTAADCCFINCRSLAGRRSAQTVSGSRWTFKNMARWLDF